jgi:hypothetical protein
MYEFSAETLACIKAKINYAHSALLTRKNTLNESEMGFAECSIFDSLLSMIVGSRGLGILNMNNSTKIRQNSKLLHGVSMGTRLSR